MDPYAVPARTSDQLIDLVLDTIEMNKQALVFVNTKRSAEKVAEDIAKKLKTSELGYEKLSKDALRGVSHPTKQCHRLSFCLAKGVAFHHAGLAYAQRELVEDNFRSGAIKIICCTPSLAVGLDLPAYRAILRDLKRFGTHGLSWIPILEAQQMFGRAGRPKYDTEGQAICVASSEAEKEEIIETYINGEPEAITSKLNVDPVLRTYLLSLIATDFVHSKEQIQRFFAKTFWAHQFGDMELLQEKLHRVLDMLEEWEFLASSGKDEKLRGGFLSAKEMLERSNGTVRYRATPLGKRVAELYIDPLTARKLIDAIVKASAMQLTAFSFLQLVAQTLEMRPIPKARAKDYDLMQQLLLEHGTELLAEEPSLYDPEYQEFINSVRMALVFMEWIEERGEDYLYEEFLVRPGELKGKIDIADWLLFAIEELSKLLQFKGITRDAARLRVRLVHGVREELLALLKLKQIGRVRARRLYSQGIKDISDVKRADFSTLKSILGEAVALSVKDQVGQPLAEEVSLRKRKGQMGLSKYDY
ncbi:TPA: hypothetical protein HA361_01165 [Candidatus Woesearchaeota archaeon]|nr:hypothetical protein [Candidatus Woesearchaeota archaeon]HII68900.1 hypothetical protein [Candidatus Woesearchaeota archaeon]